MTTENAGEGASKVMSWGVIVGIMLATGLLVGFTLGALGEVLGSTGLTQALAAGHAADHHALGDGQHLGEEALFGADDGVEGSGSHGGGGYR